MTTKRNMHRCRVCGCTDDRACFPTCSWVHTEQKSAPLCSACEGTDGDMAEALKRIAAITRGRGGGFEVAEEAARIARAARKRYIAMKAFRP